MAEDADGHPISHYGVHKQANEGAARVYWRDDGIASVGLRPHIVYGPGRDHGMTAGPTLAMAAAVRGVRYEIPFGGRAQFQYAPDAARMFINAARSPDDGGAVRNLGGPSELVSDVVAAIEAALPQSAGTITFRRMSEISGPIPTSCGRRASDTRNSPASSSSARCPAREDIQRRAAAPTGSASPSAPSSDVTGS